MGSDCMSIKRREVTVKCPMGCGWATSIEWSDAIDGYAGQEGDDPPEIGDTFEGPLVCPRCEEDGVAHPDMYEVVAVKEVA